MDTWQQNDIEIIVTNASMAKKIPLKSYADPWSFFSRIYRGRDLCYKVSSKLVSKIFMDKKEL